MLVVSVYGYMITYTDTEMYMGFLPFPFIKLSLRTLVNQKIYTQAAALLDQTNSMWLLSDRHSHLYI